MPCVGNKTTESWIVANDVQGSAGSVNEMAAAGISYRKDTVLAVYL